MKPGAIISRGESLRILENELRRAALDKHAADLKEASPEKRQEILGQMERDIQKELRRRRVRFGLGSLLH